MTCAACKRRRRKIKRTYNHLKTKFSVTNRQPKNRVLKQKGKHSAKH